MKRSEHHVAALAGVVGFLLCGFINCSEPAKQPLPYRNLSDSAHYVGMHTCSGCHQEIYQSFLQTGMGRSWGVAHPRRSSAQFGPHAVVYDSFRNFWYRPFWINDSLFVEEFRLHAGDTIYRRRERITHIVGSGQHTNSHLWWHQGYLCQAPITFYTQKGIWDLAPGFEDGQNSRWQRTINMECMTCHNMFPEYVHGAENRYAVIQSGIECERCHGPGSLHVQERLRGLPAKGDGSPDYSIVNPKHLPRDVQMQVCMRCHLQGITVLNPGKTFTDFRPGMQLSEVMHVFMPRYAGDPPRFIMASHVDRLRQSRCYQQSQMTCLTCHNPHISVKVTPPEQFNKACRSCHDDRHGCTLPAEQLQQAGSHCYQCHMPESGTLDIPHVTVHDHRIRIPVTRQEKEEVLRFIRLECLTTDRPSPLLMAQGYLQAHEAFSAQPFLLDSAAYFLSRVSRKEEGYHETALRLAFLKNQYDQVLELARALDRDELSAWTAYRIGEACFQLGRYQEAVAYYRRAISVDSLDVNFLNKYGSSLMALNRISEAEAVFRRVVRLYDRFAPGWNNLGYILFLKNQVEAGRKHLERALELDPDYEQAWLNLAAVDLAVGQTASARRWLQRVLELNPQHAQARAALERIGR